MEQNARKRHQGLQVSSNFGGRCTRITTCTCEQKRSLNKEGGQVSGVERYAISEFEFWRATCKMPLQTVLCSSDLSNDRVSLESLKLGELCEAAQITNDIFIIVA